MGLLLRGTARTPASGRRTALALGLVLGLATTGLAACSGDDDPPLLAGLGGVRTDMSCGDLVDATRAQLDAILEGRVQQMWEQGLPEEVRRLAAAGLREGPTAGPAIGYAECLGHLDGHLTRQEAIGATVLRTRQLVRRQLRWFRRDDRITWIDVDLDEPAASVARRMVSLLPVEGPERSSGPPATGLR